jgi:hypothetical protein
MAFKSIDRKETVTVVASNDPALDLSNSDLTAYRANFDESHLRFIDGEQPTRFVLGTISYLKFQQIKDKYISFDVDPAGTQQIRTNLFGLSAEALAHSIRKIENGPFDVKIVGGKASDQTMDKLASIGVVEQLGQIALDLNGFGESDEKKF